MDKQLKAVLQRAMSSRDPGETAGWRAYENYRKAMTERLEAAGLDPSAALDGDDMPIVSVDAQGNVTARISGLLDRYWGYDDRKLIAALDEQGDMASLTVLIDSVGGSVWSGLALYRDFARRAANGLSIRTEAAGIVASAATLPFVAGQDRIAGPGSLFMIHRAWSLFILVGNVTEGKAQFDKWARALDAADKAMAGIYTAATDLDQKAALAAMDAETWYSAEEAQAVAVVTEIDEGSASEPDVDLDEAAKARIADIVSHYQTGGPHAQG